MSYAMDFPIQICRFVSSDGKQQKFFFKRGEKGGGGGEEPPKNFFYYDQAKNPIQVEGGAPVHILTFLG
jgi:hypothetical protein